MQQFPLIEGAAPSRPRVMGDALNSAVAEKLLPDIIKWLGAEYDGDSVRLQDELSNALDSSFDWDGFSLATDLRDDGWCPDAELVEILDDADHYGSEVEDAAVHEWVRDYGIQPRLAVGDVVEIMHDDAGVAGIVVSIDHKRAHYTIACPSLGHVKPGSGQCGTIGLIKNFEDVEK